jgi:hypothetical protein
MTGVALPILLALLAQSADRGREPHPAPSPERTQPGPFTSAPSAPGDKAFSQLFTLPAPPQNQERDPIIVAVPDQKPATKIVCGMVVIQADPSIDPRFVVRAPADTSAHKIRRIPPQACAD